MTTPLCSANGTKRKTTEKLTKEEEAKESADQMMALLSRSSALRKKRQKKHQDNRRLVSASEQLEATKANLLKAQKEAEAEDKAYVAVADVTNTDPEPACTAVVFKNVKLTRSDKELFSDWKETRGTENDTLTDLLRDGTDLVQDMLLSSAMESFPLFLESSPKSLCQLLFKLISAGSADAADPAVQLMQAFLLTKTSPSMYIPRLRRTGGTKGMNSHMPSMRRLQWHPTASDIFKAFENLGYKEVAGGRSKATLAEPAADVTAHKSLHNIQALCRLICTICSNSQGSENALQLGSTDDTRRLCLLLVRASLDPSLICSRKDIEMSIKSLLSTLDERTWERDLASVAMDANAALPSHRARLQLLSCVRGSERCQVLRTGLAVAAVSTILSEAGHPVVKIRSLGNPPLAELMKQVPSGPALLKAVTPKGEREPNAWKLLSTMELLHQVAMPHLYEQHNHSDALIHQAFEPLFEGVGAGLKNRKSVPVFRVRLLCSEAHALYRDTRITLTQLAKDQEQKKADASALQDTSGVLLLD